MSTHFSSLRSRLALTLLVAFIPALWLFWQSAQEIRTFATASGEREALLVARAAIRDHQHLIDEAQQLLSTLSLLPEVRDINRGACDRLLAQLVGQNKTYTNLGVLSPQGNIQCSGMPTDKSLNFAHRAYFQRAVTSRTFSIGDFTTGIITKQPSLHVAQPIFDNQQQLLAVIFAALDLKQFGSLIENAQLPPNSILTIFGQDGTIFLRYPQPEQFIGKQLPHIERIRDELSRKPEMVIEVTGLDGVNRLAAYTRMDSDSKTSAYLQIAIPSAAIHEKSSRIFTDLIIQLSLVLLLIVVALGMGIQRFVISGITKLSDAVKGLAQGNHGPQISLRGESAEIAQLMRDFYDMADALQKRQHELEQQKFALDQHAIVSIADRSGNIVYANQKFCDITQYAPEALIGQNHRILNSGYHPPEFFQELWKTISAGKVWQGEIRNIKRDGSYYWVETSIVPFIDHTGKPYQYVSIRTEITALMLIQEELRQARDRLEARVKERTADLIQTNRTLAHEHKSLKAAQTQLLQSEKMASIGQLAAGLAHEINNPIGYVHSNLETLHEDLAALLEMLAAYKETEHLLPADRLEALHQLRQRIDLDFLERDLSKLILQCRDGTTRVKAIVKNLLEFSHADQGKWELTDLHQELERAITLASHGIKRKTAIVKAFSDIPKIECRPMQLSQVFINLLVNATHAIDQHGTITVRTGTDDSGVWIEIADTGSGINSKDLPRIFDPFFTTKPVGSGTGLGLPLSYRIVQDHQGRLTVDSEAGKGTTFRIWLPLRQSHGD